MSATISPCGRYRYDLRRTWDADGKLMAFIMLNPSTADAELDDPTIRRCIQFAKDAGYGRLIVGNLFAYRATEPRAMKMQAAPIGPDNDASLDAICAEADLVVCAWGTHGKFRSRGTAVIKRIMASGKIPHCLALTLAGYPQHPLYLPSALRPIPVGAT